MNILKKTGLFINDPDIQIIKELGAGFFGTTYLVSITNQMYAMKRLKIKQIDADILCKKQDGITEVTNEINNLQLINHPKMLKFYGYRVTHCKSKEKGTCSYKFKHQPGDIQKRTQKELREYNKSPYIVEILIEYIDGKRLSDAIYYAKKAEIRQWLQDLILQVKILRTYGIIHNDIHDENIMVTSDLKRAVLIDFGRALNKDILKKGNDQQIENYNWGMNFYSDFVRVLTVFTLEWWPLWKLGRTLAKKNPQFDVYRALYNHITRTPGLASKLVKIAGCKYDIDLTDLFLLFCRPKFIALIRSQSKLRIYAPKIPLRILQQLFHMRFKPIKQIQNYILQNY
jgi:serine/threonine protein kinase